jgi:hypothetical protein
MIIGIALQIIWKIYLNIIISLLQDNGKTMIQPHLMFRITPDTILMNLYNIGLLLIKKIDK